jgi:hypothetical protein
MNLVQYRREYLCELGAVNAAASGTAALNFSSGKYIGLGIPKQFSKDKDSETSSKRENSRMDVLKQFLQRTGSSSLGKLTKMMT